MALVTWEFVFVFITTIFSDLSLLILRTRMHNFIDALWTIWKWLRWVCSDQRLWSSWT